MTSDELYLSKSFVGLELFPLVVDSALRSAETDALKAEWTRTAFFVGRRLHGRAQVGEMGEEKKLD